MCRSISTFHNTGIIMLSKKEKIIFGALSALFIVPEIIWGPLRSQWHNLYTGYVLHTGDYIDLWSSGGFYAFILFLQSLSAFLLLLMLIWKRKKILNRKVFWVLIALVVIAMIYSAASLLLVYAMLNVTITGGFP